MKRVASPPFQRVKTGNALIEIRLFSIWTVLIYVGQHSALVIPIRQRPHQVCPRRRCGSLKNAPDDESSAPASRTRIIPLSSPPETSNNIIQKGLAFGR